jgi:hypothetical protein
VLAVAAASAALVGCGPTKLQVQPADAVNVAVRTRAGQPYFCPGDPFQVEVVVKMKDGTTCSSADETRGCLGQEGVIDPELVHVRGSSGRLKDKDDLVWLPNDDVLTTAGTGLDLTAWLEGSVNGKAGKSMEGSVHLKPVYQCHQSESFRPQAYGAPGPNVEVAITSLSTPYYPNAALIRVTVASLGYRYYFISPSVDQPVRLASIGGAGEPGATGSPGTAGSAGSAGTTCGNGGNGSDGTDGGPGGPGGDGGNGGSFHIIIDDAHPEELEGRVIVESVPGEAGMGGSGGPGGQGGAAGSAGPSSQDCPSGGQPGIAGRDGRNGPPGANGRPGSAGPPPTVQVARRETLFSGELAAIRAIEAKKAHK